MNSTNPDPNPALTGPTDPPLLLPGALTDNPNLILNRNDHPLTQFALECLTLELDNVPDTMSENEAEVINQIFLTKPRVLLYKSLGPVQQILVQLAQEHLKIDFVLTKIKSQYANIQDIVITGILPKNANKAYAKILQNLASNDEKQAFIKQLYNAELTAIQQEHTKQLQILNAFPNRVFSQIHDHYLNTQRYGHLLTDKYLLTDCYHYHLHQIGTQMTVKQQQDRQLKEIKQRQHMEQKLAKEAKLNEPLPAMTMGEFQKLIKELTIKPKSPKGQGRKDKTTKPPKKLPRKKQDNKDKEKPKKKAPAKSKRSENSKTRT